MYSKHSILFVEISTPFHLYCPNSRAKEQAKNRKNVGGQSYWFPGDGNWKGDGIEPTTFSVLLL